MKCKICYQDYKCGCICGFCCNCISQYGHSGCIEIEKNNPNWKRKKNVK
jgi:hypothetical protein